MIAALDRRPVVVAIAGPNGAGKSTFYYSHLQAAGLRYVNADIWAKELALEPYAAARVAGAVRAELLRQGESFVFETVFSDPAGEKLRFLESAAREGYNVILCFIGISSARVSEQRVAMRVTQGGHDVPSDKLTARFPRTMANLGRAIRTLPQVWIFDNDNLRAPFCLAAVFESGRLARLQKPVPKWLRPLLP